MNLLPELQVGLFNGWIPLILYFLGFILSVSFYSKETRIWLFNNPIVTSKRALKIFRLFGQALMVVFIVMMIFTPLNTHRPIIFAGAGLYSIGFVFVMSALYCFRRTPVDQLVVSGPYRISRNPQWVGLFLVLLGSAVATGIGLYIGMIIVVGIIYHKQILDEETTCLKKYGDSYRAYMERIPRYLSFL